MGLMKILWMEIPHQKDGLSPIKNGMFTTYQLVRDFGTIHSIMGISWDIYICIYMYIYNK